MTRRRPLLPRRREDLTLNALQATLGLVVSLSMGSPPGQDRFRQVTRMIEEARRAGRVRRPRRT